MQKIITFVVLLMIMVFPAHAEYTLPKTIYDGYWAMALDDSMGKAGVIKINPDNTLVNYRFDCSDDGSYKKSYEEVSSYEAINDGMQIHYKEEDITSHLKVIKINEHLLILHQTFGGEMKKYFPEGETYRYLKRDSLKPICTK